MQEYVLYTLIYNIYILYDCNSTVDEFHYAIGVYTFVMRKKKIFPRYYKNPYIIKFNEL